MAKFTFVASVVKVFEWKWSWHWNKKLFSLFRLILSKVSSIWNLATEGIGFFASIRLAARFPRALARRSIDWRGIVVTEGIEVVLFLVCLSSWTHCLPGWSQVILISSPGFFRRIGRLVLFLSVVWINKVVLLDWQTTTTCLDTK